MQNGRIVTSLYLSIRDDRPDTYYIRPLSDFCKIFHRISLKHIVYTAPGMGKILSKLLSNTVVYEQSLDSLVKKTWNEPKWMETYAQLISKNPTHNKSYQARYKELIGVYLSKISIIDQSFDDGAKWVLWADAGHWISHQCNHDEAKYSSDIMDKIDIRKFVYNLSLLSEKYGVVGTLNTRERERFHMPLDWMLSYYNPSLFKQEANPPFSQGMFWLVTERSRNSFREQFKKYWYQLIRDQKAGTEENALTLYCWNNNIKSYSYKDWISIMKGFPCLPMLELQSDMHH